MSRPVPDHGEYHPNDGPGGTPQWHRMRKFHRDYTDQDQVEMLLSMAGVTDIDREYIDAADRAVLRNSLISIQLSDEFHKLLKYLRS